MQFIAKALRIPMSPYKLRALADVVRGKNVAEALHWLTIHPTRRALPIKKVIQSAAGNAKHLKGMEENQLRVSKITIDEAHKVRYAKPGSMGRSNPQTRRFCHINVIVEPSRNKEL